MYTKRCLRTAAIAGSLMLPTGVSAAESVADCYERVTLLCADAMEDANWLERFAVGVICTGMLAGCAGETF